MVRRLVLVLALVGALLPGSIPATPVAAAGPASLLKAIATTSTTGSGGGGNFVKVGATLYFGANDPAAGYELWKTDGTAAGTSLVADLTPGPDGSFPGSMIELNGLLLFSASTTELGVELYLTDGTASGTTLLKDIRPGPGGSYPGYFTKAGSYVYFMANDGTVGGELWRTDGTPAGTQLVADVFPGYRTSDSRQIVAVGNAVYFTATDATGLYQLYYSTGAGATKVPGVGAAIEIAALDTTTLLFSGYSAATPGDWELWKAVGGSAALVKDIYPGAGQGQNSYPNDLAKVGPYLVFQAHDPTSGYELWRSDGTLAGTTIVKDIVPGPGPNDNHSYPNGMTTTGSYVYFQAYTAATGYELWRTDGSAGGTSLVKDLALGAAHSFPQQFTLVGSQVFFVATTTAEGTELWKTDGTAGNASLVKDINPGTGSSSIFGPISALGSIAVFAANDGTNGNELWRSDGTAAGTFMLRNLGDQPPDSMLYEITALGGVTYFRAQDATGHELWRSDGTAAGTYRLKDIAAGSAGSYPNGLTPFGTKLLFRASDPTAGNEPFISDGTAGGTTVLRDINAGSGWSNRGGIAEFAVLGPIALFSASDDPYGNDELWKTDGTNAGTVKVKEINPNAGGSGSPYNFAVLGSIALFSANNGTNGWELWKSDGTALGTVLVKNINTTSAGGVEGDSAPFNLTTAGGKVFFSAEDGVNGRQLWASDGTAAGTGLVKLINPTGSALAELYPSRFAASGSTVYFVATDGVNGVELWKSDGTAAGTSLVKNVHPTGSSYPTNLTVAGGRLYFVADDGANGRELWTSDGTEAGTVMVADLTPGAGSTSIYELALARADGRVAFSASAGDVGFELWQTNGTAAGTTLVQDINPGASSSLPRRFATSGSLVLFEADDGTTGRQLWSLAASALNLPPTTTDGSVASDGGPATGTLSATDPDGNSLTFRIVTPPTKGTATITNAATGAFTYTPNAGASGADSFTFTVNDGTVDGNVATISITISPSATPSPQPPAAGYRVFVPIAGVFDDRTGQ